MFLVVFGMSCAGVVGLMLVAMLTSSLMLIAIFKYDCINRPIPFRDYWRRWCESDWRIAYATFTTVRRY